MRQPPGRGWIHVSSRESKTECDLDAEKKKLVDFSLFCFAPPELFF